MAKFKQDLRSRKRKKSSASSTVKLSPEMTHHFLEQGISLLHAGQPEEALAIAKKALKCVSSAKFRGLSQLPVLELLGEIYVELGDPEEARKAFTEAANLDPDAALPEEAGGGADKFLWLAQLCVEGGAESIMWYEKGCTVLRRAVGALADYVGTSDEVLSHEMNKRKLANALCGAAEVYMTDLSWEEDAEARCEALVTEACLVAPNSPEPLQTLASVRISQTKLDDARAALSRSIDLWGNLPPEHPDVPEFPTRISLSRLLMEAEMEEKALDVLERLVAEDDSSVEAWYLGGWCLHLLAGKGQAQEQVSEAGDHAEITTERFRLLKSSRDWLQNGLKLYTMLNYEDDRLQDHATELVAALNKDLGTHSQGEDEDPEDDDGWEDEDDGDDCDETLPEA